MDLCFKIAQHQIPNSRRDQIRLDVKTASSLFELRSFKDKGQKTKDLKKLRVMKYGLLITS